MRETRELALGGGSLVDRAPPSGDNFPRRSWSPVADKEGGKLSEASPTECRESRQAGGCVPEVVLCLGTVPV